MNYEAENTIKRLNFENFIWVVFIVISSLDIYGDELIKKGLKENDKSCQARADKLFLFLTFVSLIIYVYFFMRNYSDYQKYKNKSYEVRLFGSILVLVASICFIYFQLTTRTEDSPSIA